MSPVNEQLLTRSARAYASYSPGELAEISGLSTGMQRVWRQRGQLAPLTSGHARFEAPEVIEIAVRYALSKLGVSIANVPPVGSQIIKAVYYHSLLDADGACEVIGPSTDVDRFLTEFDRQHDIAFHLAGEPPSSNYLIWDDAGRLRVLDKVEDVFDGMGASLIGLDLQVIGRRIVDRGRKSILTITFPAIEGHRQVRRLTSTRSI